LHVGWGGAAVVAVAWWLRARGAWRIAVLVTGIAVVFEWVQPVVGRSGSWLDVGYAALGAGAGALGWRGTGWARVAAGLLLVAGLVYPALVTVAQWRAAARFPELSDFRGGMERLRWSFSGVEVVPWPGGGWRVTVQAGEAFPGLFLNDAPRDWSGGGDLVLDLEVVGDRPLPVWVRVDDGVAPGYAERFQREYVLAPGRGEVRIPEEVWSRTPGGAGLVAGRIERVGLFVTEAEAGRELVVRRLALEPVR
jgi:hypothetical protein